MWNQVLHCARKLPTLVVGWSQSPSPLLSLGPWVVQLIKRAYCPQVNLAGVLGTALTQLQQPTQLLISPLPFISWSDLHARVHNLVSLPVPPFEVPKCPVIGDHLKLYLPSNEYRQLSVDLFSSSQLFPICHINNNDIPDHVLFCSQREVSPRDAQVWTDLWPGKPSHKLLCQNLKDHCSQY